MEQPGTVGGDRDGTGWDFGSLPSQGCLWSSVPSQHSELSLHTHVLKTLLCSSSILTIILIQPKATASPVGNSRNSHSSQLRRFPRQKMQIALKYLFPGSPSHARVPRHSDYKQVLDLECEHSNKLPKQLLHSGSEMSALQRLLK